MAQTHKTLIVFLLLLFICPESVLGGMPFKNLNFEEPREENELLPSDWSIMGDGCENSMRLEEDRTDGSIYLHIKVDDSHDPSAVCGIAQRVDAKSLRGLRLSISIQMETYGRVSGEAGMWVRVDPESGDFLAFRRALVDGEKPDRLTQKLSANTPIYSSANSIGFGFYLQGEGKISLSDLRVTRESPTDLSSEDVLAYLSEIHEIIQENSVNKSFIEWDTFWADTLMDAQGAQHVEDLYQVIPQILRRLGDRHSFFSPAPQRANREQPSAKKQESPNIASQLLKDRIGYLWMPGVSGEESMSQAYADYLFRKVQELTDNGATGWVLDLRGNSGGNMWPMLAGVSPILGPGVVGYFIRPDESSMQWEVAQGESRLDGKTRSAITFSKPDLKFLEPQPVAILAGPTTASSGEAVVVAFRCRERVKQFGSKTRGLTTANHGFELSDGSLIALTVSTFADRCGTVYGDILSPDYEIGPSEVSTPSVDDPAVEAAVDWLKKELEQSGS